MDRAGLCNEVQVQCQRRDFALATKENHRQGMANVVVAKTMAPAQLKLAKDTKVHGTVVQQLTHWMAWSSSDMIHSSLEVSLPSARRAGGARGTNIVGADVEAADAIAAASAGWRISP